MRSPQGYAVWTDPDSGMLEMDTFTCCHCNRIVHLKAREDPADKGKKCLGCMKYICKTCSKLERCYPLEKRLEDMERGIKASAARDRLIRAVGAVER